MYTNGEVSNVQFLKSQNQNQNQNKTKQKINKTQRNFKLLDGRYINENEEVGL